MRVLTKMIIIVVPIVLVSIIVMNLMFGAFFYRHLEAQEEAQINTISNSVFSYLNEKMKRLQGSANDWAHWDETFNFMNGDDSYIDRNLEADTFIDLDINFIVFNYHTDWIYYQKYYDFDAGEFIDFDSGFIRDFSKVIAANTDFSSFVSLFNLGGSYYITAASDITDTSNTQAPAGKLVIGRKLDIGELEKISGCKVVSIEEAPPAGADAPPLVHMISKNEDTFRFQCEIPTGNGAAPAVIIFEKHRDLYLSAVGELNGFLLGSFLFSAGLAALMFAILAVYFSKPFVRLIKDLKQIGVKPDEKLAVKGKDEFAFIRMTINGMLGRIELGQALVRESEEKLYATLHSVGDGVFVVGKDYKIQFMNPAAQSLSGWSQQEAIGMPIDGVLTLMNESTAEKIPLQLEEVFEEEKVIEFSGNTVLRSKDGSAIAIESTTSPVKNKNGEIIGCVIVLRDFREKKERQKEIEYLSYHDQVTGLYNRRFFDEELKRLDTVRNLPISVVYADINGLKTVNDAFGHDVGDQLLCKAAEVIKDACRADEIISRTGGDEFVILLPKTDKASAEKLVERIERELEKTRVMGLNVSLSFGWDTKYSVDELIWDTLKSAEGSMYHKKIIISSGVKDAVIKSVNKAFYTKLPNEKEHAKRVAEICEGMGRLYGFSPDEIKEMRKIAEYHDIGKIVIDESILNNPNELSESEWVQLRSHPETGYRILSTAGGFHDIAEHVLQHHERWDGKGYPKGLKGEAISLKARILMVADAYDCMIRRQPYRAAKTQQEALEEIKKNAGAQFDPEVAAVFIEDYLKQEL